MREILFRGFHPCDGQETIEVDGKKVNGSWVEGYYVKKQNLLTDVDFYYMFFECGLPCPIDPETVCQYTGLKDKNGKKIFEGDRLKWDAEEWGSPHTEIVEWDYDLFSAREGDWGQFCEVIGTVFDEVTP